MHAMSSYLGQLGNSSSFVPKFPQKRRFDLISHQCIRNQVGFSTDWRQVPGISHCRHLIRKKISAIFSSRIQYEQEQQASDIAKILENGLFMDATSQEEYLNLETLISRLEIQLNKLHAVKCTQHVAPSSGSLHAWSNGSHLEPSFQNVAVPIINATDYCAVTADNKYGFPIGGQSRTSIHEPVFSPDNFSPITACTDMEVIPKFSVSGGGSNAEANSKSIGSYFPQQQAINLRMDPMKYRDCSRTMQKNDSMAFLTTMGKPLQCESSNLQTSQHQHVSREISQVYNPVHGLGSLGDIRQFQHQKLDSRQNLKHFMQPCELQGKTSADHFGIGGSANMNSCSSSEVSVEQRILLAYFHKNSMHISRDNVIQHLHSIVCCKGICSCEQYSQLLLHFDNCQSNHCHICYPWKSRSTGILEHHSEFPNSIIMGSVARENHGSSGNSEAMQPPTKRQKMDSSAFGASLINNASSNRLTHEMVQPYSSEALTKMQQQAESPLSAIDSDVTECNVEQVTNPMLDSTSSGEIKNKVVDDTFKQPPTKIQKMDSAFGASLINNASSDQLAHEMVQPYSSEAVTEMQQQTESPLSAIDSDVTECNVEQFTNPMLDSIRNSEIKNKVVDVTFEQTLKSETTLSKGLEADRISVEPDLKSRDVKVCSNLDEFAVGLNSNMHSLHKEPMPADIEDIQDSSRFNQAGINATEKVIKPDQEKETNSSNPTVNTVSLTESSTCNQIIEEPILSKGDKCYMLEADHISEEPDLKSHDVKASSNEETVVGSNSRVNTLLKEPMPADVEDIQDRTMFNQVGINGTEKVVKPKADQENEANSATPTVNTVTLTDFFSCDQITEHIMSLRKQFVQITTAEEPEKATYICQLCEKGPLYFDPEPIYCVCCDNRIKRNANYYHGRAGEIDAQHCFCSVCYRNSRGGYIKFNGKSVSKNLLDKKRNIGASGESSSEEPWVECDKCKQWQHQICALYNSKKDFDFSAEYICPICRLKEIENGMYVPLEKAAMLCAKDLPSTMLSDHIERRLFKRLMKESEGWAKVEGNKNLNEDLVAESLSVRVVLSVDKQLEVKKQFRNIFVKENYPAEFPYTSKVILLFQQIEGVDVCLFAMYVQEFGSECGSPNQRSVYISYLDSVKYFRPERGTLSGEALRTFVYHEILIGYLDYCKKRGFTTCYIWACPPKKGEDYILYCHPDTQKTPKNDKLRHWYHSMLRKAAEEKIVVGLTNMYDQFFDPTQNCDSKVTASCLPYFDGDYWSGAAMDIARDIEKKSGGEYERMLKKQVSKRSLKAMGHVNPSKETAKDILVMQKLGQTILPVKEDFIIVHFQYSCIHCHELIVSGKRWFCAECKKFQECERCHTSDSHTSISGEKHTLYLVLMDDIPCDTKENDIIHDNVLFKNRHSFLSFCQTNQYQFDTLRRAKYSSMMILFHLNNSTPLTVGTKCSICCKRNEGQQNWKCETCREFTVCSACYKERGAICHVHKLSQTCSREQRPSGNLVLNKTSVLKQELLDVILHASKCHLTLSQCTYPHCVQIKKLFYHTKICTVQLHGGCKNCKKVWTGLWLHSRNCRDSECSVPRCMELRQSQRIGMQSESAIRAAVEEGNKLPVH